MMPPLWKNLGRLKTGMDMLVYLGSCGTVLRLAYAEGQESSRPSLDVPLTRTGIR